LKRQKNESHPIEEGGGRGSSRTLLGISEEGACWSGERGVASRKEGKRGGGKSCADSVRRYISDERIISSADVRLRKKRITQQNRNIDSAESEKEKTESFSEGGGGRKSPE